MNEFLPYLILLIFIVVAVGIYIAIKILEKKRFQQKKTIKLDEKPRLKIIVPFLTSSETKFLATFQNAIPSEYVAFPKVLMANIVKPDGSMVVYNEVKDKVLDVCVFLKKNMQPVMVIDLISGDSALSGLSDYMLKSLTAVNIPVLQINVQEEHDKIGLLNKFLDKLDPVYMAELRKKSN